MGRVNNLPLLIEVMQMDISKLNTRIKLITNKVVNGAEDQQAIEVWAGKSSVNRTEFYDSYQTGLIPQIVFMLRLSAYKLSLVTDESGEKRYASQIEYDGMIYNVVRAYETDDFIEITCS